MYYWVAIYTRSRSEKKLHKQLELMGIEAYLPLIKQLVQWSDRKKMTEKVLIPGYVFAKISEKEYYDVLNIHYAVTYVRHEGKAARIRDCQIESMKMMLSGKSSPSLEPCSLKQGDAIVISYGSFKGFTGEIVKLKSGNRLIVRLEQLGLCVCLEIPASQVEELAQNQAPNKK
jgi:transcriptional antiterminator RfaH